MVEPTGQEVCRVERSTPFALLGKIVAAWSHARRLEHLHNSTRSRRSPTQLERRRAKKYSTGWYCTGTLIACSTGYCRDTPRKPVKSKNQVTVLFPRRSVPCGVSEHDWAGVAGFGQPGRPSTDAPSAKAGVAPVRLAGPAAPAANHVCAVRADVIRSHECDNEGYLRKVGTRGVCCLDADGYAQRPNRARRVRVHLLAREENWGSLASRYSRWRAAWHFLLSALGCVAAESRR